MYQHHQYIWDLISKKMAGEATEQMLKELDGLLLSLPDLQYVTEILSGVFQTTGCDHKLEAEVAFERHLKKMEQNKVSF